MSNLAKQPKSNTSNSGAIDIFIFTNGQEYSPPRKYHLSMEERDSWDFTLSYLAHLQYGAMSTKTDLYSLSGQQVNSPLELRDGSAYVSVVPPDPFINTGYNKYLIKASRSWDKRQKRRSEIQILSKDKVLCNDSNIINFTKKSSDVSKMIRPRTYCKKQCETPLECMQKSFTGLKYSDNDSQPSSTKKYEISQRYPAKNRDNTETSTRAPSKSPCKIKNNTLKYGINKPLTKPNDIIHKNKFEVRKKKIVTTKNDKPKDVTKTENNADNKNATIVIQEETSTTIEDTISNAASSTKFAHKSSKTITILNDNNEIENQSHHSIKNENQQKQQDKELLFIDDTVCLHTNPENKIISKADITTKQDNNILLQDKALKKTSEIETEIANQLMNVSDTHTPVDKIEVDRKILTTQKSDTSPQKIHNLLDNPFKTQTRNTNFEIVNKTQSCTDSVHTDKIRTQETENTNKQQEPTQILYTNNDNETDSSFIVGDGEDYRKIYKTEADVKQSKISTISKNEDTLIVADKTKSEIDNKHNSGISPKIKGDGTDKFTTYIQRGDILNLKLTIEVRNNNKTPSNNKMEKQSQANLVLSRSSFHKSDNNDTYNKLLVDYNSGKLQEKYSQVIIIQCLCNNEVEIIPNHEGGNKKLLLVPTETIEAIRCNCESNAAGTQESVSKPDYMTQTRSVRPETEDASLVEKESVRVQQMVANFEQNIKPYKVNSLEIINKKLAARTHPSGENHVESKPDQATSICCRCKNIEETKAKVTIENIDLEKKSIPYKESLFKTDKLYPKHTLKEKKMEDVKFLQMKNDLSNEIKPSNPDCYCQCRCEVGSQKPVKPTIESATKTPVQASLISNNGDSILMNHKKKELDDITKGMQESIDLKSDLNKKEIPPDKINSESKDKFKSNSTQHNSQLVTRQESTSDLKDKSYADKNMQTDWSENILEARVEADGRYTLHLPSLETLRRLKI